jgi:hypothetical protein
VVSDLLLSSDPLPCLSWSVSDLSDPSSSDRCASVMRSDSEYLDLLLCKRADQDYRVFTATKLSVVAQGKPETVRRKQRSDFDSLKGAIIDSSESTYLCQRRCSGEGIIPYLEISGPSGEGSFRLGRAGDRCVSIAHLPPFTLVSTVRPKSGSLLVLRGSDIITSLQIPDEPSALAAKVGQLVAVGVKGGVWLVKFHDQKLSLLKKVALRNSPAFLGMNSPMPEDGSEENPRSFPWLFCGCRDGSLCLWELGDSELALAGKGRGEAGVVQGAVMDGEVRAGYPSYLQFSVLCSSCFCYLSVPILCRSNIFDQVKIKSKSMLKIC